MPQAPKANARQESKELQKAIDKEQKRIRGVMSCAECRRLKLKCDKTVPCSSCKRRGCSAICPNGKLATGQGTRFVLADTEKLHEKIFLMSDRIRQLEDALAVLQLSVAPHDSHPLLRRDLLDVKSIIDLHVAVDDEKARATADQVDDQTQYIESFGTLALRDDGAATFYGRSGGSELAHRKLARISAPSLPLNALVRKTESSQSAKTASSPPTKDPTPSDLPAPVRQLSNTFPFAPVFTDVVDLDYLVQHYLPPWPRARQLCELYVSVASWFVTPVPKRQAVEECLPLWYTEAADLLPPGSVAPSNTSSPSTDTSTQSQGKTSHELALLFIIFAFGALMDNSLPAAPDNEESNMYCCLTRAALNLEPVLDRPPSVATVQTLLALAIYQGMIPSEQSLERTWSTLGLATKLAQSIGLHRDSARWQIPNSEVQKRRALFWELFLTDGWVSLATGRLATFFLPFVDCELANDEEPTIDDDGTVLPSIFAWKARLASECQSAVLQHAQTAKVPKYSVIIELDRKVRDMDLPGYAQRPPPPGAGLEESMKRYQATNYRNYVLVYIHRCFFAEAVSKNPTDPMQSVYAPSFLAGYRSACEILSNLRIQFDLYPTQVSRVWALWTHAFSSTVMLASVVTHASGAGARSKTTIAAMTEFRRAVDLFREASTYGGRSVKFLPILERLLQKAEQAYSTAKPAVVRNRDIFSPFTGPKPKDELSIFSGRIHTLATKAPSVGATARAPPPGESAQAPVPAVPTSVPAAPVPALATLHPTLRDQWTNFEGHLNAQLTNAQRDDYYTEADADALMNMPLMEVPAPPPPPPSQQQRGTQGQGLAEQQHRLYPLTIPTSDFRSSAPYTDTSSSSGQGYGSQSETEASVSVPYASGMTQPAVHSHSHPHAHSSSHSHSHSQTRAPQAYHYQPDPRDRPRQTMAPDEPASAGSGSAGYDAYPTATYLEHHRHPRDDYYPADYRYPHQPHVDDTTPQYVAAAAPSSYGYGQQCSHDSLASLASVRTAWDDGRQGYVDAFPAQTQEHYAPRYDDYAYVGGRVEEPHLQETWQSFGVYVGSPRPTP